MANFKAEYMRYMDNRGIRYRIINENHLEISFRGKNMNTISISVLFNGAGKNDVSFYCFDIASVKDDNKYASALVLCNELNLKYSWIKFFIDENRNVTAGIYALVDISSVGSECSNLVNIMVDIVDECYPKYMQILWT